MIDRTYGEGLGGVTIKLTADGLQDPLLRGLPESFTAFTGHKEACTVLPSHAVLLASSAACPVHMFRIKTNLYATQFHPELDAEGLVTRIDIYRHAGYFPPESAEMLMEDARRFTATEPMKILRNFVERYAQLAWARCAGPRSADTKMPGVFSEHTGLLRYNRAGALAAELLRPRCSRSPGRGFPCSRTGQSASAPPWTAR